MADDPRSQTPATADWLARARFHHLADAVQALSGARSRDEVIEVVRRSARMLSGAMGIAVVVREGDSCHYLAEDSAVPLWSGQRFSLDACISGWAMLNREQVTIADIYADSRIPHDAYRPTGVHSLVMTPVGDPAYAALGAYWTEVREPRADEAAVMAALATCMATALENIRLIESLRTEAERAERHAASAERRKAEREAAHEQIRFQADLLDAVEEAVIATDTSGEVIYWNRFAHQLYGWSSAEAVGRNIMTLNIPPESAGPAAEVMAALQTGESWSGEMTLRRRDGGSFPALITNSPIRDPVGVLLGVVGVSRDNSERRRARDHQQMLINELNHRVKNTLAIVQSLATQSLRPDRSAEQARSDFEARLMTLARAHELMTEAEWRAVGARELIARTLEPFGYHPGEPGRFDVDGPNMRLEPRGAVAFSLAIHELATNAVKYGALSNEVGKVSLHWWLSRVSDQARLKLQWRESDGPPVSLSPRRGFGSRLIERGLASELQGSVKIEFHPQGVVCKIDAPAPYVSLKAVDPQGVLFPLPA